MYKTGFNYENEVKIDHFFLLFRFSYRLFQVVHPFLSLGSHYQCLFFSHHLNGYAAPFRSATSPTGSAASVFILNNASEMCFLRGQMEEDAPRFRHHLCRCKTNTVTE